MPMVSPVFGAAAAQVAAEACGARDVHGAERRHGLPAAHLHGGLHGGGPRGPGPGQVAVPGLRDDVPGHPAAHPPLLPVPRPRHVPQVPAHVAAAPPPRRSLRQPPRRPLQHPPLHVSVYIQSVCTCLNVLVSSSVVIWSSFLMVLRVIDRAGSSSGRSSRRRRRRPATAMAMAGGACW